MLLSKSLNDTRVPNDIKMSNVCFTSTECYKDGKRMFNRDSI